MEFHHEQLETLEYPIPEEILKYKLCGDFAAAKKSIKRWLKRPVAEGMKTRLRLESEMLDRFPEEFPYTKETLLKLFQEKVPDFSDCDLERLEEDGLAEWMFMDGEKHYIHNVMRNVLDKDDEIRKRAGLFGVVTEEDENLYSVIEEMKEKGSVTKHFHLKASVGLKDEYFRPGMYLKAHLPLPAKLHQTSDVKILSHTDCKVTIDPEDSLYRSICFEDTPKENVPFFAEYEYTVHAVYHDFSEEDQKRAKETFVKDPQAGLYTGEQRPHIRFTPYLQELAAEIVGEEKNPLEAARKIYDYITTKVKYSYMKEYFLIPQIPQYCAQNLRGDCGVQALLFITLCRICGIPAKWQSGLYAQEGYVGPHDWAMFYAEPYGWLYADPSFGGAAFHEGDEERRKFYFGNLEPFRMVANNAFAQPFASKKRFRPIDPCDNQSGEIESDERGFTAREIVSKKELL